MRVSTESLYSHHKSKSSSIFLNFLIVQKEVYPAAQGKFLSWTSDVALQINDLAKPDFMKLILPQVPLRRHSQNQSSETIVIWILSIELQLRWAVPMRLPHCVKVRPSDTASLSYLK